MNLDSLTAWLGEHPVVLAGAPDLVALAQGLARAVDGALEAGDGRCDACGRSRVDASLVREYRQVLGVLRGVISGDEGDADEVGRRLSTAVGD